MIVLSEEILKSLNKQLNLELRNAYLYLAMAAYFDEKGLDGFAHFFKIQSKEELGHAMRIYEYIIARNGKVELYDIPKPDAKWKDVREVIEHFYQAEVENTKRIWELVDLAEKRGDKATVSFLKWFVDEQVEEEQIASDLKTKLEMVASNPAGILALNNVLKQRKE